VSRLRPNQIVCACAFADILSPPEGVLIPFPLPPPRGDGCAITPCQCTSDVAFSSNLLNDFPRSFLVRSLRRVFKHTRQHILLMILFVHWGLCPWLCPFTFPDAILCVPLGVLAPPPLRRIHLHLYLRILSCPRCGSHLGRPVALADC